MIRHEHGSDYFLFTQHDHALLSGRLAERIGGGPVARPSLQTIEGIALHDCGWPLHDDRPTLNPKGQPLHVFETPPAIATKVWSASARRAANKDPYCGLLVSLHVLNLSAMSQATHTSPHDVFELNKFQHAQIELQEQLRPRVGLRTDRPLTNGLAHPGTSREEDAVLFDFRLLRAMDALSLALLCSEPLKISMSGLLARPGGSEVQAVVERPGEFSVQVAPWLFRDDSLEFEVPFRRLPKGPFANPEDFQSAYGTTVPETVTTRVSRGKS
jgi:hypothetical protein